MNQSFSLQRGLQTLALGCAVGITGCAVNPATGETQLSLVSEGQEIQMGREADQQLAATTLYPDSSLQQYIQRIGLAVAGVAERPSLPWTFRVMDDPVVNAFALPGGFIYITRGIMAHLNSESQLVGIVGHEVGHVTGKHSVEQLSRAQLAGIGVAAGSIFVPGVFTDAASAGLGVMFLKFGRDDEIQADELGLRYLIRAGYDPRPMPGVFVMLDRQREAAGGGGTPEWLSTHPNPGNRARNLQADIDSLGRDFSAATVNADSYLDLLDGLMYGDDPREGYFRDNVFFHPDLAFEFIFPPGWQMQNTKQAVVGLSAEEDAIIGVTLEDGSSAASSAQEFFGAEGISGTQQSARLNGLTAAGGQFTATTEQGTMSGAVFFVEHGAAVYRLLGYAMQGNWSNYSSVVSQSLRSFGPLTDTAALSVKPMRLDVVSISSAMTLAEFQQRYPSEIPIDRLALLNQVQADSQLPAGTRVKRVIRE